MTKPRLFGIGPTACAILLTVAACKDDDATPATCTQDGVEHALGASFASSDGCNTCTCGEGGVVSCTARACVDTCTVGGVVHQIGDSFPSEDGCNTCTCGDGGAITCTEAACPPVTCTYDGASHAVGDTFPSDDGCNQCTCTADGTVACTDRACVDTCTYDRQTWAVGDTFPAIDGCNTCTCMEGGQLACTEKVCQCDIDAEWWRHYVAESPEECQVVRFACLEPTLRFDNDCGCGCEQPAECEREIECYLPECANADVLRQNCPYSIVDTTRDCSDEVPCAPDAGPCVPPDEPFGCGMCTNPTEEETCAGDGDCAVGTICQPLHCACQGQLTCQPGCTGDGDCAEGEACGASGRCAARTCGGDGDCPADFRCDGVCVRRGCSTDAECSAACVRNRCFSEAGECRLPVP